MALGGGGGGGGGDTFVAMLLGCSGAFVVVVVVVGVIVTLRWRSKRSSSPVVQMQRSPLKTRALPSTTHFSLNYLSPSPAPTPRYTAAAKVVIRPRQGSGVL